MAKLTSLLPLLRMMYFFSKLCGYRHFYFHTQQQTFKMLTRQQNKSELLFSRLMYFINLAGTPAYIMIRVSIEIRNKKMNSIQPGVYPPPNFTRAYTDSAFAIAYFLNCIVFRLNQQRFVALGNELLAIYRALRTRKTQLRFSNILLFLSYFLIIIITAHFANNILIIWNMMTQWHLLKVEVNDETVIWLLRMLLGWTILLYELHLQLLLVLLLILTSYCQQLSDLLLKTNSKSLKRSEKLIRILPLLQSVLQKASRYFSFFLLLRILELLHAIYCLVNAFKYDDATLHPLIEDFEDLELDQKMYHAPIVPRGAEVRRRTTGFLMQTLAVLLELHALNVCKREHKNVLDVIMFPIDAPLGRIELNAEQIYQLDAVPDAIFACNDAELPHTSLFDVMLNAETQHSISFSSDDILGLDFYDFKVPLKMLKHCVSQICCSTIMLTLYDKMLQMDLKKLEQKYK